MKRARPISNLDAMLAGSSVSIIALNGHVDIVTCCFVKSFAMDNKTFV